MDPPVNDKLRTRTIEWEDPRTPLAARRNLAGLEVLKEVIAGRLPMPPMGMLMGIRLVEAERGHVAFEGTPEEYHYNPLGTIHGGFAATLLDSAMGCCVHTCLDAGDQYTTLEIKVNYLRPLTVDSGLVRGVARIVHVGRTIALAEARVVDAADAIYAYATSTCLIRRAEPR